jgi:ribosomal protein S12 methylthiotransferase
LHPDQKIKIGIISLGCPRNLVDSEVLLGVLKGSGFEITDMKDADIGIVNSCAFIDEAKRESIDMILELIDLKRKAKLSSVVVAGCLPQRYGKTLLKELPEVDAFVGCDQIEEIGDVVKRLDRGDRFCKINSQPSFIYNHTHPRIHITPPHYIYVKISEGCINNCSFCVVPLIKGNYRSRPIESILKEVADISKRQKLSEINLIGQDTTNYGKDLYGAPAIKDLLKKLCSFRDYRRWIRLLYTYPSHIDMELIDIIAKEGSICKYMDLPIQHINDKILKKMNRKMGRRDIINLIDKIRKHIPGIVLRSSVIVGFPGESECDFEELIEFIREVRFERLGVFTYSREEGAPAYNYRNQIDEELKLKRFNTLMSVQKEIAESINKSYLGKTIEVLIDEKDETSKGTYIGRTQGDAPEVDGEVFVKGEGLKAGDFVNVKITDTLEYDLVGKQVVD